MSAAETIETTPEEMEKALDAAEAKGREDAVEEAKKAARDAATEITTAIAEQVRKVKAPIDTSGSELTGNDDPARGITDAERVQVTRQCLGWESAAKRHYAYDVNVPEATRKMRCVQDDHYIAQWARGVAKADPALRAGSIDWLERKYGRDVDGVRVSGNLTTTIADLGGDWIPTPFSNIVFVIQQLAEVLAPRCMQLVHPEGRVAVPRELTVMVASGVDETTDTSPPGTDVPAVPLAAATFDNVPMLVHKGKVVIKISREMLDMTPYALVTLLTTQAGTALGLYSDNQIAVDGDGLGTNYSNSLINDSNIDATIVGTSFTHDKIKALWNKLVSPYKGQAVWVTDAAGIGVLNELEDTEGRSVFQIGTDPTAVLTGGQGAPGIGTMLTRPLLEVNDIGGHLVFVVLGRQAVLEDGKGITSVVADQQFALQEQVGYLWSQRRDFEVITPAAAARTSVPIAT
jgi:HK97 family phage major capsid protein